MSEHIQNNAWSTEHAQRFVDSTEKFIKYRYRPFAREIIYAIRKNKIKRKPVIVDLGSGPGILIIELKKIFGDCKLIGVDSSELMLEIAKKNVDENSLTQIEFKLGSAEQIPIETNKIDVVVCLNSLHDFQNSEQTIKEVSRILVSGGLFILKDKNGAYPKWKMRLFFIPLLFRTGFKQTLHYFKSNKLWLDPSQVITWMTQSEIKLEEFHYKKDYLIIGKRE